MKISRDNIELVLIEDCIDDADLLLRIIKKKNLLEKSEHFLNGEDALNVFFPEDQKSFTNSLHPKLIILDIKMPKLDGFSILKLLKTGKNTSSIPVIIFTSSKHEKDIKKAYELGANGFIVKPLEYDLFVSTVDNMLNFWLFINSTIKDYNNL